MANARQSALRHRNSSDEAGRLGQAGQVGDGLADTGRGLVGQSYYDDSGVAAATALAVHASLGLALAVFAIGAAVHAIRAGRRAVAAWSVLGGLFVIGAGFNGASFLDFNHDVSSLIMALLAFAAIGSYIVALFLVGQPPSTLVTAQRRARRSPRASAPSPR